MSSPSNKGGRPRIGGRLARVQLTAEQDRALEQLVNLTGAPRPQILRDIIESGLQAGTIRSGRWTYGPVGSDGTRFKWPEGYLNLSSEEVEPHLDED